jgi:hypothetical protein
MTEIMRSVVMAFWSDGGQGTARRNAWSAMAADAKRARQRTEAMAFVNAVLSVHAMPAAMPVTTPGLAVATALAPG